MALVRIPASLRKHTSGTAEVHVSGGNVRQVIDQLEVNFPGIKSRLVSGDTLRPGLSVAVDSRISDIGILEKVRPESEVVFLPSISGG